MLERIRSMSDSNELSLKEKVLWKALFFLGVLCLIIGFSFTTIFFSAFNEIALAFGLAFIIVAIALMIGGYFVLIR